MVACPQTGYRKDDSNAADTVFFTTSGGSQFVAQSIYIKLADDAVGTVILRAGIRTSRYSPVLFVDQDSTIVLGNGDRHIWYGTNYTCFSFSKTNSGDELIYCASGCELAFADAAGGVFDDPVVEHYPVVDHFDMGSTDMKVWPEPLIYAAEFNRFAFTLTCTAADTIFVRVVCGTTSYDTTSFYNFGTADEPNDMLIIPWGKWDDADVVYTKYLINKDASWQPSGYHFSPAHYTWEIKAEDGYQGVCPYWGLKIGSCAATGITDLYISVAMTIAGECKGD